MNVMVNESPFTPRAGRPVEINALWHNALRIGADLARQFQHPVRAEELNTLANRCKLNFNRRFWNSDAGCCFDVVTDHGADAAIRPNQLLAISLPYAILDVERHAAVLSRVDDLLRTAHGIRTLARGNEYQGRYGGPVLARDRAYHNGSAFPWLLGPFVTAFMRVYGRSDPMRKRAREALTPCLDHMRSSGCGQLPELFDGDEPHLAGGMIASARNVAEILRVYVEDILDLAPVEAVKRATTPTDTTVAASTVPQ
jgi:glycogen debranching enzyme